MSPNRFVGKIAILKSHDGGALAMRWICSLLLCCGILALPLCPVARAQSKKKGKAEEPVAGVGDYTSKHFIVHTDLPADDAQDLLKRMETMLTLISGYWGRPAQGVVECYVVKDLSVWPRGSLDPRGMESIQGGGGVTIGQTISSGDRFISKAVVYAVADRGTPLHESVHAYCVHAFGHSGPVWYSEGMAEMGQYWKEGDASVNAHDVVIDYLRRSEPKSLNEIINGGETTGDSWQNYAWRWALCHLLATNPNYAPRFRPLGLGILTRQNVSFESVYGNMRDEITFEYLFFLAHVEQGFRADLCSWDWKAKFKKNKTGAPLASTIDAGRGWQASKLIVEADQQYDYLATGTWTTEKNGPSVTADGGEDGVGKLVATIKSGLKLSEPFELGSFGTFTAPADGELYVRCRESWVKIADNKGKITLKLKAQGKGNPFPMPKPDDKLTKTDKPETSKAAAKPAPAETTP